jgi:flagellar hook-associated protein 1 FlgK
MSFWVSLETGVRALRAFQMALQTTQHNLANAATPGYSRQRALLEPTLPYLAPEGFIGTGVQVGTFERVRDRFVDYHLQTETATSGRWTAMQKIYSQLEVVFSEPTERAFASVMNAFWNSWEDVSNDPTDMVARSNLVQQAGTLADGFRQMHQRLNDLRLNVDREIRAQPQAINDMAKKIAQINYQIQSVEHRSIKANDLRDTRDKLIEQISEIVNVQVLESDNGSVNLYIYGHPLVFEKNAFEVTAADRAGSAPPMAELRWRDSGELVNARNGRLKALYDMRDTVIPDSIAVINQLATGFIQRINAQHLSGMGLDGTSRIVGALDFPGVLSSDRTFHLNDIPVNVMAGDDLTSIVARINNESARTGVTASVSGARLVLSVAPGSSRAIRVTGDADGLMEDLGIINPFFTGTDASDIEVSSAVREDPARIAASRSGAPGDNENALAIIALKNALTMNTGSATFSDFYNNAVARIGMGSQEAARSVENTGLVLEQLENLRESVSGVSTDEELLKMLQYQRAYEAAARLISTADSMLDTLINRTGAGR